MAVRKVKVQSSSSDKGGGGGKADALAFHKAEQMFSVCSSVIEQWQSTNRELWCVQRKKEIMH